MKRKQEYTVKAPTSTFRKIPRGMPAKKNAKGRPTMPPPMMVLRKERLA